MKAVTPLLHQESLSHLISSYFFDLHNLFSRCGGGGQGGPKNSLTKGSGPSNLADNVRGGLGDHVTSLVLGNWRGVESAEADRANRQRLDGTEVTFNRGNHSETVYTRALLQVDEIPASVLFIIWCVSLLCYGC